MAIEKTELQARYFAAEQRAIEALEAEQDAIRQQKADMEEEHGGEKGLLEEARSDAGKITKTALQPRIREIWGDADFAAELEVLNAYLALVDRESTLSKRIREAQKALDARLAARYGALTEAEVKALVVDDTWLAALSAEVQTQLDRISLGLTGRIRELAGRYATPLPELVQEVQALGEKVGARLSKMGHRLWITDSTDGTDCTDGREPETLIRRIAPIARMVLISQITRMGPRMSTTP
jgi:type I restriction enzyme M protein